MKSSEKAVRVKMLLRATSGLLALICASTIAHGAETKNLSRTLDPVIVSGKMLKPLCGTPADRLALMTVKNGQWAPIPFQVDQKKPNGAYALTNGPKAAADPDPNLDANDELVFMAKDTGDRAATAAWPAGMAAAVELEVSDPKTGGKSWVYLGRFNCPAPRSARDYVSFKRNGARLRFSSEDFIFEIKEGFIAADYFAPVDANGKPGPDILDQIKIRMDITVPVVVDLHFTLRGDQLIRSVNQGWIDGPVRVIHYSEGYVQVAKWIRFRMGGNMHVKLYPYGMEFPLEMMLGEVSEEDGGTIDEKAAKENPARITEYVYIDFSSAAYGGKFLSKMHPARADVVLDGRMSPGEEALDRKVVCNAAGMAFPHGLMVARAVQVPEPANRAYLPRIYYMDDKKFAQDPESEKGEAAFGLTLYEVEKASAEIPVGKSSLFNNIIYYKRGAGAGQYQEFLDILDRPLKVTAAEAAPGR